MRKPLFLAGFMLTCLAILSAAEPVEIVTVPAEFAPHGAAGRAEPVTIAGYSFEINGENNRTRVVVDYTYQNQAIYAEDDSHGPPSTFAQVPGLRYDPAAGGILYDHDGQTTMCAKVEVRRSRLLPHFRIELTGNCSVTAVRSERAIDDGWKVRRVPVLVIVFTDKTADRSVPQAQGIRSRA